MQDPATFSLNHLAPAVAIIQASMIEASPAGPTISGLGLGGPAGPGSRLSGRAQRLLGGRPLLFHLIQRVQKASSVSQVVVALSVARDDDALVPVTRAAGARTYRGSVHDLAGRLAGCAAWLELPDEQPVVRVVLDTPFIEPRYVDAGVEALRRCGGGAVEFLEDQAEELCPGLGAGFLTAGTLRLIDRRASSAVHRADVMTYLYEHPDEVGLQRVPLPEDLSYLRGSHRLLFQTAEDLALHEAIYVRLYQGGPIDTGAVVSFLNAEPVLASLNRGVLRRGHTLPMAAQVGWRAR